MGDRAHCTASRQLSRLESVFSRCSAGLRLFQAGGLGLESLKFGLSESLLGSLALWYVRDSQLILLILARSGLVNLISFRDFLELFQVVYLPA